MKILLVDDDAFLRDMYVTKFTESGHEVAVAANGQQGMSQIEERGLFDVVLLDMIMPGLSGVEFLKEIHTHYPDSKMKCIVLSNQGEQSDRDAATAAGAVGYIVKAESIPSEVVNQVEALAKE